VIGRREKLNEREGGGGEGGVEMITSIKERKISQRKRANRGRLDKQKKTANIARTLLRSYTPMTVHSTSP
jgi:hypothetical protein